ncbi:hypothetical protein A3715_10500 [Oleiphilus sp. HI0009]|nr:hypothetical protein A3715_10500 [Oleiphilus sp. HI0009]
MTDYKALLLEKDHSKEMKSAISKGVFYVHASPEIGGYCIGSFCNNDNIAFPAVMATFEEAESDRKEMVEEWNDQIANNEREEDDLWEGEVLMCKWDCVSDNMTLHELSDEEVCSGRYQALSGML